MSVITHVLVQGASPHDMAALNEWAFAADPERHQKFEMIDMDKAGGSKFFVEDVYAAAFNHFPWWDLLDKLQDGKTWRQSGEVFWTLSHEDGERMAGLVGFRGQYVKVVAEPETLIAKTPDPSSEPRL